MDSPGYIEPFVVFKPRSRTSYQISKNSLTCSRKSASACSTSFRTVLIVDPRSSAEPRDPPAETIATHKHLVTLFAQYEHLSKRISNSPCDEGGSQAQVQSTIARSAAMFLGKEMTKVQVSRFVSAGMIGKKRDAEFLL